ncbi:MAG: hypothetical protein P4L92_03460, partial [Rudaea sp.]|nr:hypothetical protein [Rudaea sp.]
IPVTPTATASPSVSNTATAQGGGDPTCPTTANCTSTITTPVNAPQLTLLKTASAANFVVGVAASYTLTVTNTGSAATTAVATVTDNIPGTLTIGTPPAGCSASAQTVTCAIASGLATGVANALSFVIPVTPQAAAGGTALTNTASVSGGGDPSCPGAANCTSTVVIQVDAPQLTVMKTASAPNFVVGVAESYTLQVTNTGTAATTAIATVTDNIPAALTIGTLPGSCSASGQTVTCTIAAGLATGGPNAVSFVIPVTPTAAASGTTLTNTASVTGGGDPSCPGAAHCVSTVGTPVDAPMLQIVKTASAASFTVNGAASYTLTVTNVGNAATTTAATVDDAIPANLSIGTVPGACNVTGQQVTCTIAAGLAAGAGNAVSFVIPVTPTAAASGTTLANTATVSGGGDPTCPAAPECSSTVTTPVGVPVLQIVKTGPQQATAGHVVAYSITVTNIGAAAASNAILTDPAPGGLSFESAGAPCAASGFPCNLGTLIAGQSVTVSASFLVASTFSGTIINTATVSSDQTSQSSSSASTVVPVAGNPAAPVPLDARWAMLSILGLLAAVGAWRMRARR